MGCVVVVPIGVSCGRWVWGPPQHAFGLWICGVSFGTLCWLVLSRGTKLWSQLCATMGGIEREGCDLGKYYVGWCVIVRDF